MYLPALRKRGERNVGAPIACIGSGTGLGQTFLTCPTQGEQARLEVRSATPGWEHRRAGSVVGYLRSWIAP